MHNLFLLRKHVMITSGGAAYDDLEIGPVPVNEQWYVEWAACYTEAGSQTYHGVAVKSAGALSWLDERAYAVAGKHEGHNIHTWLNPGESLIVRVTGSSNTNVVHAYATGDYRKWLE
jgi:hypothetical protein